MSYWPFLGDFSYTVNIHRRVNSFLSIGELFTPLRSEPIRAGIPLGEWFLGIFSPISGPEK